MRRYLTLILMSAALGGPAMVANAGQKFYDDSHRDYHKWNHQEEKAYRHWLDSQHRQYMDWKHANKADQAAYWRWRHDHPGM